ncbi:hypothetical protein [Paraburkholderia sp. MM5384-R2]|uniref:hypothetical protein n=1 Tax=Paraburkholderia sp. MM5384-R2 TaxID=2723097 RepID=UPI0017C4927A|nr:hypothetical protein [Paraburkholderia sp. MM5384-R2]MBB5496816.1 acetyl esterase/lipase [Paraburkholderia sp. MM5384-R2]
MELIVFRSAFFWTLRGIAIQAGTDERLLDDARRYAAAAAQRGNTVQLEIYEGLHHAFQRSTDELASARYALDQVAGFVLRCGSAIARP